MGLIRVPKYAARNAAKGLKLRKKFPEGSRPGMSSGEASRAGVDSGVEMARRIKKRGLSGSKIRESTARQIRSTLARHHGQADGSPSRRQRVVFLLWGDDSSGRFLEYLERKLE